METLNLEQNMERMENLSIGMIFQEDRIMIKTPVNISIGIDILISIMKKDK